MNLNECGCLHQPGKNSFLKDIDDAGNGQKKGTSCALSGHQSRTQTGAQVQEINKR